MGLVAVMSLAMAASLLGLSTSGAVTPTLIDEWGISNSMAGWLNGIFFAGYMLGVPFLVGGADRIDARAVFLVGCVLSVVAMVGMALAGNVWVAMAFRFLGGIGYAGCYMPGLKALVDRYSGGDPSRAVSFYTASYAIGAGASFWMSGAVAAEFGWRWAFGAAAAGPLVAFAVVSWALRPDGSRPALADWLRFPNFLPVFSNRPAMGYIVAYTLHTGELFVFLSWVVAFLTFAAALHPISAAGWDIPFISFLVTVVALPSSIVGNEIAIRFGRRRTIIVVMMATALIAAGTGFSAALSFPVAALMCLVYGTIIATDSSALTAGTVGSARPDERGATMALHSFLGFGGGAVGPLILGATLDLTGGGETVASWGIGFTVIAALTLIGPPVLLRLVGGARTAAVRAEAE